MYLRWAPELSRSYSVQQHGYSWNMTGPTVHLHTGQFSVSASTFIPWAKDADGPNARPLSHGEAG